MIPPSLSLAYWLGPWAEKRTPRAVARTTMQRDGVDMYVYSASTVCGVYVVCPGMHHLGPDDPRLDRFCRILARAGFRVYAPKLRDFLALAMAETAKDDLAVAFAEARSEAHRLGCGKPTLMSISFGSRPAIAVAASEAFRGDVGHLVLFGGFFDFEATMRFALSGHAEHEGEVLDVAHDPLNAPVVFLNLLPWLETQADRAVVARAWREMVARTWGQMHLKVGLARAPIAYDIARDLGDAERALFLLGCGLAPGPTDPLNAMAPAWERARAHFGWTDPTPDLARVTAPITIVHGRDDDVIPVFEASKLARAAPGANVLITGMYGHTGSALPSPRELATELRTLLRVVRTLGRV
jgi:pimeloyl-ACP methyl ester carboxylesterase